MPEVDDLTELKREIVEARALGIKTNNLVSAIGGDVKAIAKRQSEFEARARYNGWVAYVVFVVVVLGVVKVAWDARIDAVRGETAHKSETAEHARKEAREIETRAEERLRGEARAHALLELLRQGKKAEAIEAWPSVEKEALSRTERAVLGDAVARARGELAQHAYQQGLDRMRVSRWQEAATSFEEALRAKPDAPGAGSTKLALGKTYRHLGRPRDAIVLFGPLAEGDADKDVQHDALYELAQAQTEVSAWNDAKASWKALLKRFPETRVSGEAHLRLAQLEKEH